MMTKPTNAELAELLKRIAKNLLAVHAFSLEHAAMFVAEAATRLRSMDAEPLQSLRLFVGAAFPVASEINPRGYNWSEAYLDQALVNAKAILERG